MNNKLERNARLSIPAMFHPGFRTELAVQAGVETNLLFRTWGGLGDQICAEPTLRYALKAFKNCKVSLESEHPELFQHLSFHEVFDLKKCRAVHENYLVFETITPPNDTNMVWLFFSHLLTNCVDFPSLCALRMQLPVADREVRLDPIVPGPVCVHPNSVIVHAGRHWATKTFPADWWNKVLLTLRQCGAMPVLIGANTDDNRGTVDVDTTGCLDLRNRTSILETIELLLRSRVLLTNDSAPLHMAVPGNAHIGYVATAKHPDCITHWRKGQWSWRMKNFGKGGVWDLVDYCPNKAQEVTAEFVEENILRSWLPDPEEFAVWGAGHVLDGEE